VWEAIVTEFGPRILHDDGSINRARLAEIVFSEPTLRERLNGIIHPAVMGKWEQVCDEIASRDPEAIVLNDVPLLIEVGWQNLFDFIILVHIPPEKQIERLMARNGLSLEEAKRRLEAQLPIHEKIAWADIVFDNTIPYDTLKENVQALWKALRQRARRERKEKS